MDFVKPAIGYSAILPILIVFGAALVGVLVEAFVARGRRFRFQVWLTAVGIVAALADTVVVGVRLHHIDKTAIGKLAADGALAVDGPTIFVWGIVLVVALGGVLLFAERALDGGVTAFAGQAAALPGTEAEREASAKGLEHTEVYPLLLFAVGGMLIFPAANDLLTMFVGLEVLSLPLYLLCGLARRRRLLSQEAALKYFLLGAFSSGFFVYGIALVYGYAGSVRLSEVSAAISARSDDHGMLLAGVGLLAVGLFFKVGAVPFHSWTPDVYHGAPTPVTAFMSAATKAAAFGALLRLFYVGFGAGRFDWTPMVWIVAVLTMLVGSLMALTQTDVKRMLAYSSVAHAGFLLTGFIGLHQTGDKDQISSLQAVLFYLAVYSLMVVAAFAIVSLVRDAAGEVTSLQRWAGLGRRSPLVASSFALLLLGMAGIPLTSGFTGKWAVFASAASGGAWPLVVAGVLISVIAAFFYIRVIVLMFFAEPDESAASVTIPSPLTSSVIAVGVLGTLVFGVLPTPLLDLAGQVGIFVR